MPTGQIISRRFATTRTIAASFLALVLALAAVPSGFASDEYLSPLKPADTSSPRATLEAFRDNFDRAFRGLYELKEFEDYNRLDQARAIRTLDTSELPPVQARRLAAEKLILLNEVLDKVALPPSEEIPDAAAMLELPAGEPKRWQIPGTAITIERIESGPRQGEYLFSKETVERIHEFYDRAQNLTYQPDAMEGFYARMLRSGGTWFPTRMADWLPHWATSVTLGQAAWKWLVLVVTFVLWILVMYGLRRLSSPNNGDRHYWLRFFFTLLMLPVTSFARWFADQQLLLAGALFEIVDTTFVVLYVIVGAMAIVSLGAAVAASLVASPRVDKDSIDANLISVGCTAAAWLVAILFLAKGASALGVPLAAVVTSLGVGGAAFALAARPTLENLIAGVTLYLDKPVKVGEFCQFEDVLGTVERIGLRSTKIRRWGGHVLSIPNSKFVEHQLDNYNDARYIWIRQRLRLRYETSADQLRFIIAKLREMLFAHPKVLAPRVRLIGFYDDALKVEILGYSDTGIWAEWHAIREDVFLRAMQIVEASGTRLALPSQTTYFARDDGVDEDKKRAAEAQVHEWTEKGELPFPDMSEEQREALQGTVDFPPAGSVEHGAVEQGESAKD